MKRFLLFFASLVLFGYLVYSILYFKENMQEKVCEDFKVFVKDSIDKQFIQAKDIELLLKKAQMHPIGKPLAEINTMEMEEAISANKLVKSVEVFTTHKGCLMAIIHQRNPVMRVISHRDGSYYIDAERERMPTSQNYTVYLPLATGYITEEFAKNELYDFVMYISRSSSWDALIEHVVVDQDKKVHIVPRAGDFKIALGTLDNYKEKLDKLQLFIDKGLNTVGWNRYSEVNLEYSNQVVCTLR